MEYKFDEKLIKDTEIYTEYIEETLTSKLEETFINIKETIVNDLTLNIKNNIIKQMNNSELFFFEKYGEIILLSDDGYNRRMIEEIKKENEETLKTIDIKSNSYGYNEINSKISYCNNYLNNQYGTQIIRTSENQFQINTNGCGSVQLYCSPDLADKIFGKERLILTNEQYKNLISNFKRNEYIIANIIYSYYNGSGTQFASYIVTNFGNLYNYYQPNTTSNIHCKKNNINNVILSKEYIDLIKNISIKENNQVGIHPDIISKIIVNYNNYCLTKNVNTYTRELNIFKTLDKEKNDNNKLRLARKERELTKIENNLKEEREKFELIKKPQEELEKMKKEIEEEKQKIILIKNKLKLEKEILEKDKKEFNEYKNKFVENINDINLDEL